MTQILRLALAFSCCFLLLSSCNQPQASEILSEAQALCSENKWDEAAAKVKKLLPLGSEHPRIYALYAYIQNHRGAREEADKYYYKAYPSAADPEAAKPDPEILTMLARIHQERGEYDEAIKLLRVSQRADPDNATTIRLMMLCEIQACLLPDGRYDLKKYARNSRAVTALMGRKHLRDSAFYNLYAIKSFHTTKSKKFMINFLSLAMSQEPTPETALNLAVIYDVVMNSKTRARMFYDKFLKMTEKEGHPHRSEVEYRLEQLQGLRR